MRKKILYKNILNNEVVKEYEENYSERNISEEEFENIVLQNLTNKIIYKEIIGGLAFYSVDIEGSKINISFQNLRNSGVKGDDKKRFQIGSKLPINNTDNNSWFVGSYNTGNKILFVLTEDIDFAKKVKGIKSLSSIWVDFNGLVEGYKYGKSVWDNKSGRRYFCFDSSFFNYSSLISSIKKIILNSFKNIQELNEFDEYKLFDESIHVGTIEESINLIRDSELRKKAIIKAGFKCEICKTENTFIDKNGEMYFEGHHLIPYNYNNQQNFKYLLDTQDNIVCLCPNCHKKIHYADNKSQEEMLRVLSITREKFLKNYNIKDLNDIINLYNYE